MLSRRGFIAGLGALVAAPAIVRVENIMPVRAALFMPPAPALELNEAAFEDLVLRLRASGMKQVLWPGVRAWVEQAYTENESRWEKLT